jgi:hypothetical protein
MPHSHRPDRSRGSLADRRSAHTHSGRFARPTTEARQVEVPSEHRITVTARVKRGAVFVAAIVLPERRQIRQRLPADERALRAALFWIASVPIFMRSL